jgi:hypothetical protein
MVCISGKKSFRELFERHQLHFDKFFLHQQPLENYYEINFIRNYWKRRSTVATCCVTSCLSD